MTEQKVGAEGEGGANGQAAGAEEPAPVAPPAVSETQPEPDLTQKELAPRPVEIRNPILHVTPGLIQIEGSIEVAPGSTLQATLQRNNEPFDNWANPDSRQTVVQDGGQFFFNIQTADQANRDLFALEPANYQVAIISVGTDTPVIASVRFDTFGSPTGPAEPTVTPVPTSSPSPTLVARLTIMPTTATPTIEIPEAPLTPIEDTAPGFPIRVVSIIAAVLCGVVTVIGLMIWVIIRRRKQNGK
jgi:hypothetical protein